MLLRTEMSGGHMGAPGRFDRLAEFALTHAFALWACGLAPVSAGSDSARQL